MNYLQKKMQRFKLKELVLIAVFAALGIALKPLIVPIAHLISGPLLIPGGALAGGFYMMWMVVVMGLVGKPGVGALFGLTQAILVVISGIVGSHGLMSFISYVMPGVIMDLGLLVIRHKACCLPCCFFAGVLANITGVLTVNLIFFRLPAIPLFLSIAVGLFSGGAGGVLAWEVLKFLKKYHIGKKHEE